MNIPILRVPFSENDRHFIYEALDQVFDSGFLTMGKFTIDFEERFADFQRSKYAIACGNATCALEIIIRSIGIQDKSVIIPTNTFLATGFAVIHSGNRIIFADSNPHTLCLDIDDAIERIDEDTAAIIMVHIGGTIDPEIKRLKEICDERGIYLIEDCAHAHGSNIDGQMAGIIGIAGAFSFFPTKVLVTGEGGIITTDDEALYKEAMKLRNHGKDPELSNHISVVGNNWRMSEITAVVGVQQMRRATEIVAERQAIAQYYDHALKDMNGIVPIALADNVISSYYKYIAYLDEQFDRTYIKKTLKENFQVNLTGEVYADLCHKEPLWHHFDYDGRSGEAHSKGDFPGAEYLSKHHICLPLYPGLTQEEVEWVIEALGKVLS